MTKRKSSNIVEDSPADFGPEEITSSSEEIMKLKQLHEQLQVSLDNNSKKRKKRNLRPDFNKSNNLINDDDRPLDASVIESLKASKDAQDDAKPISNAPSKKLKSAILIT